MPVPRAILSQEAETNRSVEKRKVFHRVRLAGKGFWFLEKIGEEEALAQTIYALSKEKK